MPIANCFIDASRCAQDLQSVGDLVALWSRHAGESSEHMSLNCLRTDLQQGRRYVAMAWLYLPSLWSSAAAARLQLGLAKALAEGLQIEPSEVHVITTAVESGRVVENAGSITW